MAGRTRKLLRSAAESDNTFERMNAGGREYLVGKCIHCLHTKGKRLDVRRHVASTYATTRASTVKLRHNWFESVLGVVVTTNP
jgi:hypothetical protein